MVFPGGNGNYLDVGEKIFKKVKEFNDNGQFYPLFGICQGYEYLSIYTSDLQKDVLQDFVLMRTSIPVEFTKDTSETLMFSEFTQDEIEIFESKNVTFNAHNFAIGPDVFKIDDGLREFWDVTSVSYMPDGRPFVASVEAKDYPIFAT